MAIMLDSVDELAPPPYLETLRCHFEATEPELWSWFAQAAREDDDRSGEIEVELLKSAYRIGVGPYEALPGVATVLAGQLGLAETVVLYQALADEDRNARVVDLGDTVHIVFSGDLLDLLNFEEQRVVLAHELAHVCLDRMKQGAFGNLRRMLERLDAESSSEDALAETARRTRLYTEIWCDAVAQELVEDQAASISVLVKVHSGIRHVDPDAYLRQARHIIERDPATSQGWSHPELHLRVAALAAEATADPDSVIQRLVEGPDDLDRLDLLGQFRLNDLTARLLTSLPKLGEISEDQRGYIDGYVGLRGLAGDPLDRSPFADDDLVEAEPSVRYMMAAIMADVALIDEGVATTGPAFSPFQREASRIGVGTEFDKIVARATGLTAAKVRAAGR